MRMGLPHAHLGINDQRCPLSEESEMSANKDAIKSDLAKSDAYVLTSADYEEIPELPDGSSKAPFCSKTASR
jgi:hypothetical protein